MTREMTQYTDTRTLVVIVLLVQFLTSLAECHLFPRERVLHNANFPQSADSADGSTDGIFDNGVLEFLIEVYTDDIINDLRQGATGDRLTPEQAKYLRDRLKGLYSFLKNHPALMDRRLKVGSTKPEIPSTRYDHLYPKRSGSGHVTKRLFEHALAFSVCPSRTEWRQLRVARDINDTAVEVFQPSQGSQGQQWFYTVRCDVQQSGRTDSECPQCCRAIDHSRYASRCITKHAFVMALVRKLDEPFYDWNWIQVESSCNCGASLLPGVLEGEREGENL